MNKCIKFIDKLWELTHLVDREDSLKDKKFRNKL